MADWRDMNFDETIRGQVRAETKPLLDQFSLLARELAEKPSTRVFWNPPPSDIRRLLNHHIDVVWASHVSKFALLAKAIIQSANDLNFLEYGLVGRSLIEHTAVLRHHLVDRANPILEKATNAGMTTFEDISELVGILDTLHRGGAFDWKSLLTGDVERLRTRKPTDLPRPARIRDCIDSWKREDPSIGVLYGLFCDLVHPNVGTNLLVMKQWPEGIGFGGHDGRLFGVDLFERTIVVLAAIMNRVRTLLNGLLLMRLPTGSGGQQEPA